MNFYNYIDLLYALPRINSQPMFCYLILFHFLKSVKVIVLRVTLS